MRVGFKRARRFLGEVLGRSVVALASAFAAGCLAAVLAGLPFFAVEKLAGWALPAPTVGLVMLGAGGLAAGVAVLNAFRGITVALNASSPPRRSFRQRLNAIPWFRRPPWVVPDRVAEESADGTALKQRLVSIAHGNAHYRDRHTGQLWQAVYWEQGFGSGYDLVPVGETQAYAPDRRRGERAMPWDEPDVVYATPSSPLGERLFARLDRIAPDPAYPADTGSGLFRDRHTGQHWRSSVVFGEQGDDGHVLTPVLPPSSESEPGKPSA